MPTIKQEEDKATKYVFAVALIALVGGRGGGRRKGQGGGKVYVPRTGSRSRSPKRTPSGSSGPAPGSTGYKTTVEVTQGAAKVAERFVFAVENGQILMIGGGAPSSTCARRSARKVSSR